MCGILGLINLDSRSVKKEIFVEMNRTQKHRGPDGEGIYFDNNVALGHRRLSIIDLEGGHQPMSNEDGTVWITYNGEIYNFSELRLELERKGHLFKTKSDTEVIIHAYEEWGEHCLERLRGMFAFGLYDKKRHKLFVARDRLGIKPVVYYTDSKRFAFASELKALVYDNTIRRSIDVASVNDYFDYGYIPAPRTIYADIYKLQPGHYISLDFKNHHEVVQTQYWRPRCAPDYSLREQDIVDTIVELLSESVKMRLISDVPIGAFLSGGIDSSIIVALMSSVADTQIKTFSVGFREEDFSETQYARILANRCNTDHTEYTVKPDITSLLPKLVYHFDEPFADASAIPTYYVSKNTRQHVTVALSGDGGDELFAGYERYNHCLGMGAFDFIPDTLRRIIFHPIDKIYPQQLRGKRFICGLGQTPNDRFMEYMANQCGPLEKKKLFAPDLYDSISKDKNILTYLHANLDLTIRDPLARYLDLDIKTFLPNDILTKVDVTSMMNSLEVRVPFLDHRFVEYVCTIPAHWKYKNGKNKYILKRAVRDILPSEILNRGKMGFGVPIRKWMTCELRGIVHEYLLNRNRVSGLFQSKYVEGLVRENEQLVFQSRTGGRIWWILFFEMWYQDIFKK